MIDRLMNPERPYGEPEYSRRTMEITQLRSLLDGQLDQQGRGWLEQLANAYLHQENAVLCDAFSDGFWSAVELMLEYQRRKA